MYGILVIRLYCFEILCMLYGDSSGLAEVFAEVGLDEIANVDHVVGFFVLRSFYSESRGVIHNHGTPMMHNVESWRSSFLALVHFYRLGDF